MKRGDYYYLLVAEGGTLEHHLLSIGRSKSIWGPYESFEKIPIMTADGKTDKAIENIGHGDVFQDEQNQWWALVLGVRNDEGRFPLGRETFIAPVSWPEDGWPTIEQPKLTFSRVCHFPDGAVGWAPKPAATSKYKHDIDDLFIRDRDLNCYQFDRSGSERREREDNIHSSLDRGSIFAIRTPKLRGQAPASSSVRDHGDFGPVADRPRVPESRPRTLH